MNDPSVSILVINTNVKHELSGGEYAQRRAECATAATALGVASLREATAEVLEFKKTNMNFTIFRRARHVVLEIDRTLRAVEEIRKSNWTAVGHFMYESHYSLRDDFEVSCSELDTVVKISESIGIAGGIYGCRMTGGGFGGSCVALVHTKAVHDITNQIAAFYKKKTGIASSIFSFRPAAGATVVKR